VQKRYNFIAFGWFAKSNNVREKCSPTTHILGSYARRHRCAKILTNFHEGQKMKTTTNLNIWLVISMFLLAIVGSVEARTITVQPDGSGDYPTIQAAINGANLGDEVVLEVGTYTGDGNRNIDFLGKAITVRSTNPNDPQIVETTIIDCNDPQGGTNYGISFDSGETAHAVLSGISITNSIGAILCENQSSPTIRNCNLYGNNGSYVISCAAGSPNIDNCVIQGNLSGGGVLCTWQSTGPSSGFNSQPTIVGCSICGNRGIGGHCPKRSWRVEWPLQFS